MVKPVCPRCEEGKPWAVCLCPAPCPVCGGTGKKTSDGGAGDREDRVLDGETGGTGPFAPHPSVPPVEDATPDRQSGEGPAGASPDLPADLIDRAVEVLLPGRGYAVPVSTRSAIERVVPLLIAYGREQEKARWEARIEKLATWEDRARAEQSKVARWLEESGSKMAREVREDEYRHAYTGRVLRSLRTEEGENGE